MSKKKAKKAAPKKAAKKASEGNPFFAMRVPRKLLTAFARHAKHAKTTQSKLLRGFMSDVTGVPCDD